MVSTKKTSALKTVSANIQCKAPVTPGTKVRKLTEQLENKEKENAALQSTIADLTKVLEGLNIVKEKIPLEINSDDAKKSQKDENMPLPAKTAYRFFCDSVTKTDGMDMRKLWKESSLEVRQKYTAMAEVDKARFEKEFAKYNEEKLALEMYYQKKKQDIAMEFYDAHSAAKASLEKVEAEKNKGKKTKKDPDAPKHPVSSYIYFTMEKRELVVKQNPEATPTEVTKIIGEMWNSAKGKKGKNGTKKFDDLAAKDKARYNEEKAAYDAMNAQRKVESEQEKLLQLEKDKEEAMSMMKVLVEQESKVVDAPDVAQKKKKKKDPNAPKGKCSAYIFFCVDVRAKVKAELPENSTQAEILSEAGRRWKSMTEKQKAKYVKLANKDKERYEKEMKKYNAEKATQK